MPERRLLPRRVRQRLDVRAALVGEPSENGIRERDGALQTRAADELDRLVDGGVTRHAVEERELERSQAQRRANRRVEPAHGAMSDRLDRMVERPRPLHRPVRQLARERSVALVEPGRRGAERPVGIGLVLEDAPDDVEGCGPRW